MRGERTTRSLRLMNLLESSQLLKKAREGDPAAFQALIRPHLEKVYRFARSFARDWTDAEDIAQEALLKAFSSLKGYREEASLSTWLFQITKNTGIDWYRGKLAKSRDREDEIPEHAAVSERSQEQMLEERERAEALWEAIHELDAKFRVPLVLFEIEGMSTEEVSRIEGIPLGTVRSRLTRARRHLAEALGRTPEFSRITPIPSAPGAQSSFTSSEYSKTS